MDPIPPPWLLSQWLEALLSLNVRAYVYVPAFAYACFISNASRGRIVYQNSSTRSCMNALDGEAPAAHHGPHISAPDATSTGDHTQRLRSLFRFGPDCCRGRAAAQPGRLLVRATRDRGCLGVHRLALGAKREGAQAFGHQDRMQQLEKGRGKKKQ